MGSDSELNEIGVLKRREIEARLLAPIVDALGEKFGRKEVFEVVQGVVVAIASPATLSRAWMNVIDRVVRTI